MTYRSGLIIPCYNVIFNISNKYISATNIFPNFKQKFFFLTAILSEYR
jgi:hypothetical protein